MPSDSIVRLTALYISSKRVPIPTITRGLTIFSHNQEINVRTTPPYFTFSQHYVLIRLSRCSRKHMIEFKKAKENQLQPHQASHLDYIINQTLPS